MNHLEAFTSNDGRSGRAWTNGSVTFKRKDNMLHRVEDDGTTIALHCQVAAMDGDVEWVQVSYGLTYPEALVALYQNMTVSNDRYSHVKYKIVTGQLMAKNPAQGIMDFDKCKNGFTIGDRTAKWRVVVDK